MEKISHEEQREIGKKAAELARAKTLQVAEAKGVTLPKAMLRLKQALNARETKFFQKDGEIITRENVVAHGIRLQATKMALELYEAFPIQRHEVEQTGELIVRVVKFGSE